MTDLVELAQRVCMGEYVPPLKDGISPQDAFDAMFAPMKDQLAKLDKQAAKIAEAARGSCAAEADEHETSERRMEEAERRARAESEDGDVEPWSAQP